MLRFILISFIILTVLPSLSLAGIPKMINYQGMLTDNSGTPLTDTVNIIFKIYDNSSGGNLKWQETQNSVPVINGLFNVILGSVTPIDTLSFSEQYWLDITVDGENMPSRLEFTSTGYAYRAWRADTASVALSAATGMPGISVFVRKTGDESVTNSTTLQDDDHLYYSLPANSMWETEILLQATTFGSYGGIRVALEGPSGATLSVSTEVKDFGTGGDYFSGWIYAFGTPFVAGSTDLGGYPTNVGFVRIQGLVSVGGASGTFKLQWAQGSADTWPTFVHANSYMKLTRVQ
jgi:hypothetical protein